jgi:hypothetical protein
MPPPLLNLRNWTRSEQAEGQTQVSALYYVKTTLDDRESGPYTSEQIGELLTAEQITLDTPCRPDNRRAYGRVSNIFDVPEVWPTDPVPNPNDTLGIHKEGYRPSHAQAVLSARDPAVMAEHAANIRALDHARAATGARTATSDEPGSAGALSGICFVTGAFCFLVSIMQSSNTTASQFSMAGGAFFTLACFLFIVDRLNRILHHLRRKQ